MTKTFVLTEERRAAIATVLRLSSEYVDLMKSWSAQESDGELAILYRQDAEALNEALAALFDLLLRDKLEVENEH